ncbi:hypothetical protein HDU84_006239 [Entophlyctis sp. JEL0112]|nr:hypothetical protein HDU84_006239 [Entophlyctis sp. JEL0112]
MSTIHVPDEVSRIFSLASTDSPSHARLANELVRLISPSASMSVSASHTTKKPSHGADSLVSNESLDQWLSAVWCCILCMLATKRVARVPAQKSLGFVQAVIKALSTKPVKLGGKFGVIDDQFFVNFLLEHLSQEIDDDMHERLKILLIQRSRDKDTHVRIQASLALTRFQGPSDDIDEEIVSILVELMSADPSPEVRKALLWNIEVSSESLLPLLQRAADVDGGVRRMVYLKFAACLPDMMQIPREVRVALLDLGFRDRDPGVRKKCRAMVCDKWWKSREWDVLEFLREIDITSPSAVDTLTELLAANCVDVDFVSEKLWGEQISPEFVFFAFVYVKHLSEIQAEDKIHEILPSLSEMADTISKFNSMIKSPPSSESVPVIEFITTKLLQIVAHHDFSDEMGRRRITRVLKDGCEGIRSSAVEFDAKFSSGSNFLYLRIVVDAVCDIDDSSEPSKFGENMDSDLQRLLTAMQCLEIIRALFERIEKKFAIENMNLFLHTYESDNNDGKKVALQIIFDLVMVHGADVLEMDALVYVTKHSLELDELELVTLAVEGAAKLHIMKFLSDAEILEALLILYFHPHTAGQHRLRQCLSCFFAMFAFSSLANQTSLAQVAATAFMAVSVAYDGTDAPGVLPPNEIAAQIVEWTDNRRVVRNEDDKQTALQTASNASEVSSKEAMAEALPLRTGHAILAVELLEVMLKNPAILKDAVRMLNTLHVDCGFMDSDRRRICRLAEDVEPMLAVDSLSLKGLKRFVNKVQGEALREEEKDNDSDEVS